MDHSKPNVMSELTLSRRRFLEVSVLFTGGLLASCASSMMLSVGHSEAIEGVQPDTWLHISTNGTITYHVPSVEMGQGVQTSLAMIVAEELDADWTLFQTRFAENNTNFNNPLLFSQMTAASRSIWGFWEPMRILGASVRHMLIEAAAMEWQIPLASLRTDNGWVIHPSGEKLRYAQLVEAAAKRQPPRHVALRDPSSFKFIGKPIPRVDIPLKVTGEAQYGIDVSLPNLRVASLSLCPVIEGDILSLNADAALALPGVEHIVRIPKNISGKCQPAGVAVVANSYHTAKKALDLIEIQWDEGQYGKHGEALSTESVRASMARTLESMPTADVSKYSKALDVIYETPFLTQAPLEPMNATAEVTPTHCNIWAPTQNTTAAVVCAEALTGLHASAITVHTPYLGGGFGRRLEIDYVAYAVYVAKRCAYPIKLIWSREQDMKHGYYRPASQVRFQVGLDASGYPDLWHSLITAPHYFGRFQSLTMPVLAHLPIDQITKPAVASGMTDSMLAIGPFLYWAKDFQMDVELADLPVPTGNHRGVMHSYTGFYSESVVDEAAYLAGIDPCEYRRQLILNAQHHGQWISSAKGLDHTRLLKVLDTVAEQSGWGRCPEGHHQGIALSFSNKTFVAQVVELSVDNTKKVTLHKITAAVDCGIAVNPDNIKAQFEGGIFWALCGTFSEEITLSNGRVDQSNFYDYRTLYTRHMPPVDTHIIASAQPPSGVGEPAIPALIPSVTNAIFAATGERIRRLPIKHNGFTI